MSFLRALILKPKFFIFVSQYNVMLLDDLGKSLRTTLGDHKVCDHGNYPIV